MSERLMLSHQLLQVLELELELDEEQDFRNIVTGDKF
jgi:hypothetical protein